MGRSSSDIFAVLTAARPIKLLPLWALLVAGALVSSAPLRVPTFAFAAIGIIAASFAAMHINIFTDVELDRTQKPELWRAIAPRRRMTLVVVAAELLLTFGCCVALALGANLPLPDWSGCTARWLFCTPSTSCPNLRREARLKIHWGGHFVAMFTVYLCLWSAGFLACDTGWEDLGPWLCSFALLAWPTTPCSSPRVRSMRPKNAGRSCTPLRRYSDVWGARVSPWGLPGLLHGARVAGPVRGTVMSVFLPPAVLCTFTLIWLGYGRQGSVLRFGRLVIDGVFVFNRIYILVALVGMRSSL